MQTSSVSAYGSLVACMKSGSLKKPLDGDPAHRRRLSPAASPATASSSSFRELRLPEIVAHAGIHNTRSHRVMSQLGMSHGDAGDFDHPRLDEADPLRRQVLYRMKRNGWLARL